MDEKLDILLLRHLDGTASPEEMAELNRRLASDPAAAQAALAAAGDDLAFRHAFATATEQSSAPAEVIKFPAFMPKPQPERSGWFIGARRWAAVAAAVVVAAGITFISLRSGSTTEPPTATTKPATATDSATTVATLTISGGGVTVERNGVHSHAATGIALSAADKVRTPIDSGTTFAFADSTSVQVGPASVVGVGITPAGGKQIELTGGVLTCNAAKQTPGKPLVVVTPQARVTVVGTQFTVRTTGRTTRVEVREGTVRVTRGADNASVDVSAGEFVTASGPEASIANGGTSTPAFPAVQGKDMSPYWSTRVKPAGIDH